VVPGVSLNLLHETYPALNNSQRKTDTQDVRSKGSWPALVGRRCNRLGLVAAMRERQPRRQLAGRLLWGLAVKGHHRRGHSGFSGQLGTPAVADRRHLDVVRTPTNGLFEMFDDHLSGDLTECVESDGFRRTVSNQSGASVILRRRHLRSSEGKREGSVHTRGSGRSSADPVKEKCASAGCPQDFHASSTGFPQQGPLTFVGIRLLPGM
jgi:hypothetical protein